MNMKLLFEGWRKYLDESAEEEKYFGDWITAVKAGQIPSNATKFGSGAFRVVYEIPGENDFVIKVLKNVMDLEKLNQNKWEFDLQKLYPNIFPKVYAHSPDYRLMAVQRVVPLEYEDAPAIEKTMFKTFPNFIKTFKQLEPTAPIRNSLYQLRNILMLVQDNEQPEGKEDDYYNALKKDQAFANLSKYTISNNFDLPDFDFGNVGYNPNTYEFLIIDAGLHIHQGGVS